MASTSGPPCLDTTTACIQCPSSGLRGGSDAGLPAGRVTICYLTDQLLDLGPPVYVERIGRAVRVRSLSTARYLPWPVPGDVSGAVDGDAESHHSASATVRVA